MEQAITYHEVFVVSSPTFGDLYVTWALATVGLILLIALLFPRFGGRINAASLWSARIAAVGTLLLAIAIAIMTWREHNEMRERYRLGRYEVVEGPVYAFTPGGDGGHRAESFRVGSQEFTYRSTNIMPAFHRTVEYGGPIRPGLQVRISHVDGQILRLEIGDTTPGRP